MSLPANNSGVLAAGDLVAFAQALAGSPEHWRNLATRAGFERAYEAIWSDEYVNAWVIRWSEDSNTGFHDHDSSAAGITVLEGRLIEERLALSGPPVARRYSAGDCFHLSPAAIHRVRHEGSLPALSIHAYSPPLSRQGVYRTAIDGALERDSKPYTEELRAPSSARRV